MKPSMNSNNTYFIETLSRALGVCYPVERTVAAKVKSQRLTTVPDRSLSQQKVKEE